ncbi:putative tRNA-dihydrouridine synthase [Methyloligella halotolerans]|uniref:tRNA-dihydrouridine(20/20a) synthase n=1 Tax=Methyloligella halotolerans TaxID=1177755 RepID=A0A1E2RXC1_9HYPH|nr:tRNA dihydrouridine(20/20a) synthase DusA [Methyloligella halotolerans]ODA66802.1 putative tRNA-dihydrouridine synthase [Methyloligella halotolerans]
MTLDRHRVAVAPMMEWTDRHCRYFLRLISPRAYLYTEMVTADAVIHGDRARLLGFDASEHPVSLQLGGSDPARLAEAAKVGEGFGYDEINLNIGCPSDRVQSGRFGACLMAEPKLVAECVAAMRDAVSVPVTVKCRIGIDDQDTEESLDRFIDTVAEAGCESFFVHARKAWLEGLSPKENRDIPPLDYDRVYRLKARRPELEIVINGGIATVADAKAHLDHVDGVMLGRAAYHDPYVLAEAERVLFGAADLPSRVEVLEQFLPYAEEQIAKGVRLQQLTRHLLGLFHGQPKARAYRRLIAERAHLEGAGIDVLEDAIAMMRDADAAPAVAAE